jgi:hypothetical protein
MIGIEYKQETASSLRTSNSTEAMQYMDCAEFVCRVMGADQITNGVQHMNSSALKSYFDNTEQFEYSENEPQVGDLAVWKGHVGVVTAVGEDGKFKLTHARGEKKLSKENSDFASAEDYRDSEFYGFYRPINETPDGKLDNNSNSATNSNSGQTSKAKSSKQETVVADNTRVASSAFIRQISNLQQGKYKVVNGQIVPE